MDVFSVFQNRISVRSYKEDPVSDKVLFKVLEAARLAPSASNIQPWHFIVVKDKEKRKKIAKGCRYGKFLSKSPVVIVACGNKKASSHWYTVDTAIALEHAVLAATALNLGSCWIGMFNEKEIRESIGLPKDFEIIALIALGFPYKKTDLFAKILHTLRPRKKLQEIISLETFRNRFSLQK
jgi:nitroreductase